MISITGTPENLTACFAPIVYTIESSDASENFEVEIYDQTQSELLGIKRYTDLNEYTISLGEYLQYQFDIQPNTSTFCTLFEDQTKLKGISIKPENMTMCQVSYHTFAWENASLNTPMSDAPTVRNIAWNQSDELAILSTASLWNARYIFSGSEEDFTLELNSLESNNNVINITTDMQTLATILSDNGLDHNNYSSLKLCINSDDNTEITIIYNIQSIDSQDYRLCWLNKYGALDYYTFNGEQNSACSITKQKVYSSSGYKTTSSELSKTTNIYSDFVTNDTIKWLSEILASPLVWHYENGEFKQVDVISDSCTTQSEDLLRLSISLREIQNDIYQHL